MMKNSYYILTTIFVNIIIAGFITGDPHHLPTTAVYYDYARHYLGDGGFFGGLGHGVKVGGVIKLCFG